MYMKRCTNFAARFYIFKRRLASKPADKSLKIYYKLLNVPVNSKQDVVKEAFLKLAKKYHPDSGSPDANIDHFVEIETAYRKISKHNIGVNNHEEIEMMIHNIKHTAPQHRQYLSFDGVGYGTPFQRQKQWAHAKAEKAAENVMEYRIAKTYTAENTLMQKGQTAKKHDIKTKYGFDRLVEDLIQESMSKGEFENLSGKGKPLKSGNRNPYVDFTTHKLNEVLINNGFTPEWITMNKDIDQEIDNLKEEIRKERMFLGPHPLKSEDKVKWDRICESNKEVARTINSKINTYNLIVPLLKKQKYHVNFDDLCQDILINGQNKLDKLAIEEEAARSKEKVNLHIPSSGEDDLLTTLLKALGEIFTFRRKKKNFDN